MTLPRYQPPNPELVIETLENSGLDKESTLIIGGAVLAILGIRHAHDIDVMVPHAIHNELLFAKSTPSGWPLEKKLGSKQNFLQVSSMNKPLGLPLEIVAPERIPNLSSQESDEIFRNEIKNFTHHDGYAHLPLELVLDHKINVARRRKDKQDIGLIKTYTERKAL